MNSLSLGAFTFERNGGQIILHTPTGSIETGLHGFLRGVRHLLTMGLELEGEAELDGGFVFRVHGDHVRLKLGSYVEIFPLENVETLFKRLVAEFDLDSNP